MECTSHKLNNLQGEGFGRMGKLGYAVARPKRIHTSAKIAMKNGRQDNIEEKVIGLTDIKP